jgi:hypothetical protein
MGLNPQINNSFRHQTTAATNPGDAASVIHLMKTEHLLMDNIRYPSKMSPFSLDESRVVLRYPV